MYHTQYRKLVGNLIKKEDFSSSKINGRKLWSYNLESEKERKGINVNVEKMEWKIFHEKDFMCRCTDLCHELREGEVRFDDLFEHYSSIAAVHTYVICM